MRTDDLRDPRLTEHYRRLVSEEGARWRPLLDLLVTLRDRDGVEAFGAFTSHDALCLQLTEHPHETGGFVSVRPAAGGLEVAHHPMGREREESVVANETELEALVLARMQRLLAEGGGGTSKS